LTRARRRQGMATRRACRWLASLPVCTWGSNTRQNNARSLA
jgi:hypothetical protein